ncbi:hypothetical protein E2562_032168 [Oryza meyeriana var. granulata]|uniref:Uncharacterized protein n=1 Tax=Oryza meyeriana var. granulata TaxID=110450 RepID=A0A6G1E540_9ORYZ|nr:hypothetical protein E2562_032168 [Oryza meyeriana var. granulata]
MNATDGAYSLDAPSSSKFAAPTATTGEPSMSMRDTRLGERMRWGSMNPASLDDGELWKDNTEDDLGGSLCRPLPPPPPEAAAESARCLGSAAQRRRSSTSHRGAQRYCSDDSGGGGGVLPRPP